MPGRPTGRKVYTTEGGSGVHKRGEGLGTGPVGSGKTSGSAAKTSSSSGGAGRPVSPANGSGDSGRGYGGSGNRGGGGGGLLKYIIIAAVLLLGGGGGLGALLNGGSSSSTGTSQPGSSSNSISQTAGTQSGSTQSSSAGSYAGSDDKESSLLEALLGGYGSSGYDSYSAPDFGTHSGSGYGSYGSGYNSYGSGSSSQSAGSQTGSSLLEALLGGAYDYGGSSSGYGSSGSGYGSSGSGYSSYGTGSGGYSSGSSSGSGYGSYGSGGYSSGSYSSDTISGAEGGLDLSSLSSLFGTGVSSSAAGLSTGWNDGKDNRGQLNESVAKGSRSKFTKLKGNGRDTVTIMVYMCGTDLESGSGMATSDLSEMAGADLSDNINLLIYTGGCSRWKNNVVSSSANQIYRVRKGGLERLVDSDGDRAMTDPDTLSRFIKWCAKNYPANRNELIFWDHGSGSLSGYGYDQKHSREGSMDLSEIRDAIDAGGVQFDFIGFDACLMATVENALALSDYADYLLASEETEPGTGWYYTGWLSELSADPGMATTQLGRSIIDDFIEVSNKQARGQSTTLSLVDLAELSNTFPKKFKAFSQSASEMIQNREFKTVSSARNSAREFATTARVDQVDLADMAWKIGNEESMEMVDALLGAIKYNRTSSSMCNSYGLSIYFPGSRLSKVDTMVNTYNKLGMDKDFSKCISQYATMQTAGQSAAGGSTNVFDMLSSSGSYSSGWYESPYGSSSSGMGTDLLSQMIGSLLGGRSLPVDIDELGPDNTAYIRESGLTQQQIEDTLLADRLEDASLQWTVNSEGQHVLTLSDEQWDQVALLTVNRLFDDGEGYIDLGHDNVFSFTQTGELIGETNRTWLSVDGLPVAYYCLASVREGDTTVSMGEVPCLLNGERVKLIIVFDAQNPYGYIAGARRDYVDGETETQAKSLISLQDGDVMDFICDYYDYDGNYLNSYSLGERVVNGTPLISNTDVGDGGALVSYRLRDLYGQEYWTPAIAE